MTTNKTVKVKLGAIGFEIDSKKKRTPQYRFNTSVVVAVVGEETKGCDEFAHIRLILLVEGKRLSVKSENCEAV